MKRSTSLPRSQRLSVGVFEDATGVEFTLRELERIADFRAEDCSLLARRRCLEAALHTRLEPLAPTAGGARRFAVASGPAYAYPCIRRNLLGTFIEVAATGGPGPVLASSGPLAEIIARGVAEPEAGAVPLFEPWLPAGDAARLQAQLDAGSLLLWIPVQDSDTELRACRLLLKYSRCAVSAHDVRY